MLSYKHIRICISLQQFYQTIGEGVNALYDLDERTFVLLFVCLMVFNATFNNIFQLCRGG
jgi:hypothetical protein